MFIHITLYFTVPKAFTLQKAETYKQQKWHAVEDKRQQGKSFPVSVCTREQISAAELLAIAPIPIAQSTHIISISSICWITGWEQNIQWRAAVQKESSGPRG